MRQRRTWFPRHGLAAVAITAAVLSTGPIHPSFAATFTDATGRAVTIPDHVSRVLPAGPPAAVLIASLAPDLLLGWPHPPSDAAKAFLPQSVAGLPSVPVLTGKEGVTDKIIALKPDLILDYGDVSARYVEADKKAQTTTSIPVVLLDGTLSRTPQAYRDLGRILGRAEPAETLATLAQAVLDAVPPLPEKLKVVYARGEDGLNLLRPGSISADVFAVLGWSLLAPEGGEPGALRHSTIAEIASLDPDLMIFADPTMAEKIAGSKEWQALRAVQQHLAFTAPHLPFGWIEEPPSVNRLLGVAWLTGDDPGSVGALVGSVLFGRLPDRAQIATLRDQVRPIGP